MAGTNYQLKTLSDRLDNATTEILRVAAEKSKDPKVQAGAKGAFNEAWQGGVRKSAEWGAMKSVAATGGKTVKLQPMAKLSDLALAAALNYGKVHDNGFVKTISWFLEGAKKVYEVRKFTPVGRAVSASFFIYEAADQWAEARAENESAAYLMEWKIDLPLLRIREVAVRLSNQIKDDLDQDIGALRQPGIMARLAKYALENLTSTPEMTAEQKQAILTLKKQGWNTIVAESVNMLSEEILVFGIYAFIADAYATLCARAARHRDLADFLDFKDYKGYVDPQRRERLALLNKRLALQAADCRARLDEIRVRTDSAASWMIHA